MTGKSKPRRDVDELSVALGNKEHPSHVRGISSMLGLKHGWPQELDSYRTMQCYKKDLMDALWKKVDAYFEQKFKELKASQGFFTMVPTVAVPSSVASITFDTFPIDTIDTPTPCAHVGPSF